MLPTVLAGERGWFSCDRCRTHAVSGNKQDVDPWRQRRGKEKINRVENKDKTIQPWEKKHKNMQNHKKVWMWALIMREIKWTDGGIKWIQHGEIYSYVHVWSELAN